MIWPIIKAVLWFVALWYVMDFIVRAGREIWQSRKVPWKEEKRKPRWPLEILK